VTGSYGDAVAGTELPSRAARTPPRGTPGTTRRRTLWEEGHHPGRRVVCVAALVLAVAVGIDLLLGDELGSFFDLCFVLVCTAAALAVRPRDFFTVGVLPPLLLAVTVAALAFLDPGAIARADDVVVQAFVSGLAHHALALVLGYALTLTVLGLRQVALRHDGSLWSAHPTSAVPGPRSGPEVAPQLGGQGEGQ
jgi:hypothetical protein